VAPPPHHAVAVVLVAVLPGGHPPGLGDCPADLQPRGAAVQISLRGNVSLISVASEESFTDLRSQCRDRELRVAFPLFCKLDTSYRVLRTRVFLCCRLETSMSVGVSQETIRLQLQAL
jgi:hypothetical protein